MKHGSLFSGIGGFDLAASWQGWQNVFQVEFDLFCTKILAKQFPTTKRYLDIKDFDGTAYQGKIDIITGGFPCQPFSGNGKRKGKADSRYLWPEMLRVIREVRPRYVLGENVIGLISKGLDSILTDLEAAGYRADVFNVPALAVGAKHQRQRLWILAHSPGVRLTESYQETALENPSSNGLAGRLPLQVWDGEMPTPTGFCGVADGIPDRVDRLYALGNAIVPQVAYYIFDAVKYHAIMSE